MRRTDKIPILYYYTTVETMQFILQNANIYATNLKYMNDSEEYSNGLKEMKKILNDEYPKTRTTISASTLEENIEGHTELYSISFSKNGDLLSQWSMYAKESGVSLKMNFDGNFTYRFYPKKSKDLKCKVREYSISNIWPKKVYYLTEHAMKPCEYKKTVKKIVGNIENTYEAITLQDMEGENAIQVWQDMTPYVKRYEFQAEEEYRLAFTTWSFPDDVQIGYRNDKHVLKPYLDVECEGGWPVEAIIVGPGFNQQVVFTSLKHYLQHAVLKVASIDGKKFQKRCKEYFSLDDNMSDAVKAIWNEGKHFLCVEDIDERYRHFEELNRKILNNSENVEYKEFMSKRFLSRDGLILSMSEIPYIY